MNTALHLASELSHPVAWIGQRIARTLSAKVYPSCAPADVTASMARNEFRSLRASIGDTVECVSGSVWLTQDGDCRDVLLEPGQTHVVDRAGRLIVHALASSVVRFRSA